jgi:hypothetical protein
MRFIVIRGFVIRSFVMRGFVAPQLRETESITIRFDAATLPSHFPYFYLIAMLFA